MTGKSAASDRSELSVARSITRGLQDPQWRTDLPRLAPLGLPLLPCGAGREQKGPIDPATGYGLSGWETARFSVDQIQAMNGVVRSVGTRTGDGLLCFDLDGATALELAQQHGCNPQQAQTWQVHRTTDPCRLKVIWRLTAEQQAAIGAVTVKAHTQHPPRNENGKPTAKGEAVEVFHHPGRQVLLLGQHVPSNGFYIWPDGQGPEALAPITPAWWAMAQAVARGELGLGPEQRTGSTSRSTASSGTGSDRRQWRQLADCPICGRDTTGYCAESRSDGAIRCFHGSTFSPEISHGVLKVGATITARGTVYGYCGTEQQSNGDTFSTFRVHQERRSGPQEPLQGASNAAQVSTTPNPAGKPEPLTFEQRWAALESHADAVSRESWPLMKAIASLSDCASGLDLHRLSARNLEQLIEAAHRRQRPTSAPLQPGAVFTVRSTPWAVDGVFRHGLNLLVGQAGAGKSRLAAACVAAWLRGDDSWLGRSMPCDLPPHQRHALIIGTDQPLEDWGITLEPVGLVQRLGSGDVQVHARLTLHTLETGTLMDADGLATIRRWCDDHPNGVVVVDSLAACLPPGIDEDKPAVARPIHALVEALGSCWGLLTHHSRKGAGKDQNLGVGAGRGSSAIDGAVSRVIGLGLIHKMENGVLTPQESDPRRELLSTKRGGAALHLIVRSDASGFWSNEGSAENLKRQERRERTMAGLTDAQAGVLAVLEDATDWLTGRQVAEGLLGPGEQYEARGSQAANTRKVLKRLEAIGLIETQRVGLDRLYRLTGETQSPQGVSQCEPLAGDEFFITGSNGSNAAAQGISPAHPLAHTGSHWLSPVAARGEPLEPVPAECEPPCEPPKPLAPQRVSQESHPDSSRGEPGGSHWLSPVAARGEPLDPPNRIACTVDGEPGWTRRAGPIRGRSVLVIHADGRQLAADPQDVEDAP